MSGVIGDDGVQYERCNQCNEYVELTDLLFAPSPRWPDEGNVDLCPKCYKENNPDQFTKRT